MSGTLAMAAPGELRDNVTLDSQATTQIVSAGLAKQVVIDGQDFVPPQPYGSHCPQWYDLAMDYFSPDEWNTIDFLLHRESRCNVRALNPMDTNGKPSYSLFQINGFWCSPSRHYDKGFLQEHGVLTTCEELFDPVTQFRAARAIYVEGLVRHGVGWRSWGDYPETR